MTQNTSESQCNKLFEHLNYCLTVVKKNVDKKTLEIFKRVDHDVEVLFKFTQSLIKYSHRREAYVQRLEAELEAGSEELDQLRRQIQNLNGNIELKNQEIKDCQNKIENLKVTQAINASYCSSVSLSKVTPSRIMSQLKPEQSLDEEALSEKSSDLFDDLEVVTEEPRQHPEVRVPLIECKEVKSLITDSFLRSTKQQSGTDKSVLEQDQTEPAQLEQGQQQERVCWRQMKTPVMARFSSHKVEC